ncbi:MAG: ribosome-binding factor A [Sulfurimonas sp. RIFCSPHIGHO2_12_FULL_36_9]|uniref:30S ribosome-binding factor RbfA n=1 Tax=unclassified Sulfurimonas TaxID=2623549 RepID=UPI0008D13FA7|nr:MULTISPECIES: 30S ribosome-binding factor RbfA [unclassified Sulfurimonas]OHD97451.1 MAG: ribosome-binding factor A [Sulfurimonas sp. RIFCSPLOWO2_02_FULL_36_28]OHD99826.1 MAG: ribosome-binding factor A [Sulfurimonas sp. RIFCSPHIGHO2_12_FULL_36_9]OHE00082.1 MAG: ribosome-binding factor A [Sulfurimonas sp. RIFCSPLOWO2_12_36_12]OHE08417.1 MAG: ribosome-binding factor A [Sulfurimonas sp. RIFCSPLOWO2_12_FULL_36_74]
MTEAQIKIKRTESILLELIPAALGSLNDQRLHKLDVIDVKCSRGRSDAKIYLDPASFSEEEKSDFIRLLKNARPIVETYCMKNQGWFRSPKFTFEFDEQMKKAQSIEELFKKIAKE